MNSGINRRNLLAAIAASGAGLATTRSLLAQTGTPVSSPAATPDATPMGHDDHGHDHESGHEHEPGTDLFVLVGDPEAKTLSVYNAADGTIIETLTGVVMNSHAGALPLADSSVLVVDDEGQRLMHIEVHGDHLHTHEAAVPGHVAHIAVESDHAHYCAVGTSAEDEHQLHLVNLEDWTVTSVQLPDADEVGLMLTHDNLFHRNNNLNRLEAYDLHALTEGTVEMLGSVEIGTMGHGEAVNEETGELFMLTDDGVDIAYWESPELTYGKTLDWPASEPASSGFFGRIVANGAGLLTYTAERSAPETAWQTWTNRSVLYDIVSGEPIITDLPDGYVFRYALAEHTATYVALGGEEDTLVTLDVDPASATYGDITSTVVLEPMSNRAVPGDAFYEKGAYRAIAVSPDGSQVFVTQGGDGLVHVVNLNIAYGSVTASWQHESPLTGGGTLAVFGSSVPMWDTIGR